MDHEVLVTDVDGDFGAVAADGVEESFADVEIERVAEFVLAGDATGFDTGGEVASAEEVDLSKVELPAGIAADVVEGDTDVAAPKKKIVRAKKPAVKAE